MRTTINLEVDAFQTAKAKADHEGISLGQAVSRLILQAVREKPEKAPLPKSISGAVFQSEGGKYSSAEVEAALDDE